MLRLIVSILLIFPLSVMAILHSPQVIQSFDISNGGTNTIIYALTTDRHGRLWVASTDGLYIYNGVKGKKIFPVDASMNAYSFVEYGDDIFVGLGHGILKVNQTSLSHELLENTELFRVTSITILDNTLYFSSFDQGLWTYDLSTRDVSDISYSHLAKSKTIQTLKTYDNAVWAGLTVEGELSGGLLKIEGRKASNLYFEEDISVQDIDPVDSGLLLTTSTHGLIKFQIESAEFEFVTSQQEVFTSNESAVDNHGCIWTAAQSGALKFCDQTEQVESQFTYDLPPGDYETVYFDEKTNIVWFGRIEGGVRGVYLGNKNKIEYLTHQSFEGGLSGTNPFSVYESPDGEIWISYNGQGLDIINSTRDSIQNIKFNDERERWNHVLSMRFASNGTLFLGTFGGGVAYKPEDQSTFIPFITDSDDRFQNLTVMDFAFDDDVVWIATIRELIQTDGQGHVLQTIPKSNLIAQGNIYAIESISKNELLIASSNGLIKLDKQSYQQTLLNPVDEANPGCDDGMMDLARDNDDTIWFISRALCKFDLKSGRITSVSRHPLYVAGMTAIFALPDGKIAGHDGKLAIYDPQTGDVKTITSKEGHFLDHFTQNFSAINYIDNRLVIAASGGLAFFNVTESEPRTLPFGELFVESLTVMNKLSNKRFENQISLEFEERVASITLGMTNYFDQNLSFFMDVPGVFEDKLTLLSLENIALPAAYEGVYQVSITAESAGEIVSRVSFELTVLPPWWRSTIAILAYLVLIIVSCTLIVWYQITKHKRENQRLSQLVEERTAALSNAISSKEQMFENISHEFRTPLTIILNYLESDHKYAQAKTRKVLAHQSERLLLLVNSLLSLTEIKNFVRQEATYDLSKTIALSVNSFESLAEERHLHLHLETHLSSQYVTCHKGGLELVFNNLLGNAIKYANERTEVLIQCHQLSGILKILVKNKSEHIDMGRLNQRYVKHPNSDESSGLGLSIVEDILNELGGEFSLIQRNGEVTVIAQLPVSFSDSGSESEVIALENSTELVKGEQRNGLVLIVEDNAELKTFIEEILEPVFGVETSSNGKEALGWLHETDTPPDLILSDVMMPEMDGFQFCRVVKQDEILRSIPFLLLTAKGDVSSQEKGLQIGADDYILKPFNANLLVNKITNIINTYSRAKQLASESLFAGSQPVPEQDSFKSEFQNILRQRFADNQLGPESVAAQLNMSSRTLNRKLAINYGMKFTEILRKFRVEQASKMVANGGQIKHVAFDCGFSSASYFSQCFKQEKGFTPQEYLRSLSNGNS